MTFFVYGLIDPKNSNLRYVGFTSQNLNDRISQHCRPSKLKINNHKNNWIKSIQSQGLNPSIISLEEYFSKSEALQAETEMIAYLRYIGCDLTNVTDGGDEGVIYERTDEIKSKISKSSKGRTHKEETKCKISQSLIGKKKPAKTLGKELIWKQKLKEANLGKKVSEENKIKSVQNNPGIKLNQKSINQILEMSQSKKYSQKELSVLFNVSPSHICRVIQGKYGRYLP